ncbi:MAG: DUF4358 domain-containing protein [Clostridiales bacterium]|nr:DUF4358 domain-containing protein [Clostridiales bacterium]
MKKITAILLAAVFALAFLACSPKENGDKPAAFDAEATLNKLLADVKYAAPLQDVSQYADFLFSDLPEGTSIRHFSAGGKYADAVLLFTLPDETGVPAVKEAVSLYLDSLKLEAERYEPAEASKLQNAVIYDNGAYLFVVITADTQTAEKILG